MKYYKIAVLCLVLCGSIFSCTTKDEKLQKEAGEIINKIEEYKALKNQLPSSLTEIGIKETEQGPLYYEKKDSARYIIWYGASLGESVTYDSETKMWKEAGQ